MPRIKLLIVDDQEVVRAGLRLTLEAEPDMQVVGEAASPDEAVRLATTRVPNIVLLDAKLREGAVDGPDVCRRILASVPKTAVIMLSNYSQDPIVLRCLAAGAKGYLIKDVELSELKKVIRSVYHGSSVLDPKVTDGVISRATGPAAHPASDSARPETLSDTDLAIIGHLAHGLTNKEIGARVNLSPHTVKDHLEKIAAVLGVHARTEIVAEALKHGLI